MKSANGALILVLGILSLVGLGCLAGIPAWIMGANSMKDIEAGRADPSDRGMVQAGMILGIISTVLSMLAACIWLLAFGGLLALGIGGAAAGAGAP